MTRAALGGAALFGGIALLANILLSVSLPLGLLATASVLGAVLTVSMVKADARDRHHQLRVAGAGVAAGLVATLAYDAARALLSQLDPSPFNPFEAIRIFGLLLLGEGATTTHLMVAGTGLHLVNGICFGLAYVALFGQEGNRSASSAIVTGISWGLFLELFQLTLYPNWLRVTALAEFATISAFSHAVFGAVLGLSGRALLRRLLPGDTRPLRLV
jgi:hypothetical protein